MSVEMDEDDDFYAPEEPEVAPAPTPAAAAPAAEKAPELKTEDEDLEEGEEEDEGGAMDEDEDDDSDIDIITERKDGTKAAPPSQSKYSEIRNIPQRTASTDTTAKAAAPVKKEESAKPAEQARPKSNFDAYAVPTHKPTGKPLTQVSIDEDLGEDAAPWRKPGTDISDYFNYGFDEFSWTVYAQKQTQLRAEYSQEAMSQNSKKMMEEFNSMMMLGGMPPGMAMAGMPGAAGGAQGGAAGMGGAMAGMDGMPPEMQQMMQQMMASGMDPSQMDPSAMFAAMQGGAGGGAAGAGGGGQGGQNQNFGGAGFGGGQGQGYGYDQQQQNMGGGGRGGFGGRGRGGRRNW
ncbi:hypothetical protein GGTG_03260 [Gaeumannomyces tritici R3-111a-1]|uniref:Pre-mRNA polyadenylation factor Fip1 domain-containing protein n=1 Tax=Gaeumannomyces tritici (strain R3-111a-1) TaxID=644352 RepID=J3NPQ3_GAET3|nr:hypothetical protein GGTG_03260 [Gaeumannomyces tritici R3-111a-1]EJT78158.1 hypothetical protein GGTG_03260 [Gaeumannomyces tritici R3-111a-1]